MSDRQNLARAFLGGTDWADATRGPLAGDASNRRYERLRHLDGRCAVLMDAPADRGEDVRPFVRIARHLRSLGLSAPEIYAEDPENGFLLLEDLGDALLARVVEQSPQLEPELYTVATQALVHLHQAPLPSLTSYDTGVMLDMAGLAFDWYQRALTDAVNASANAAFTAAFRAVLERHITSYPVLIQRDYHAENLLWLPERSGVARIGMLDFQDAQAGHQAYDLVSLLQDARRDVPPTLEAEMIRYYCAQTGQDQNDFEAAYFVLGAQRNLRIIGVFVRICMTLGKARYIDLIPRVWGYLMRDFAHPVLRPLRDDLLAILPEPTPDNLQILKDQCKISPKL